MKLWEREQFIRGEGKEEGQEIYNQLILKLNEEKRLDDIVRVASDSEYLHKLYQEYGIK